jgi:hypothetical protein
MRSIGFKLNVCEACASENVQLAACNGHVYSHADVLRNSVPSLLAECDCHLEPVGSCWFCEREAADLEIAATPRTIASIMVDVDAKNGETRNVVKTICGHCLIFLTGTLLELHQKGEINRIAAEIAPRIVPAKNLIVPPSGFRKA